MKNSILFLFFIFLLSCKTVLENKKIEDINKNEIIEIEKENNIFGNNESGKVIESNIFSQLEKELDNEIKKESKIIESQNVIKEISKMSIEEKRGLLVFCSIPDKILSKNTIDFLKKYKISGIVLFSHNIENEGQLRKLILDIREKVNKDMFIAIDQEGGEVSRISWDDTIKYSARYIGNNFSLEQIYNLYYKRAKFLLNLGINIILGPICDITYDRKSYIYYRSYGGDPDKVSRIIETIVKAQKDAGIISVLKHFPGLGSTYVDTHISVAEIKKTINELKNNEFKPFIAGINAGAEMVLIGHILNLEIDSSVSSLSYKYYEILKDLGFNGIVLTDDLSMTGKLNDVIGWGINIISGERKFIEDKLNKILPDDNVCYQVYQLRDSLNRFDSWSKK